MHSIILPFVEDSDLLDHLNPLDLYCLHYIFLPRINHQLQSFRDAYSQHRLRTERNMSPLQLWIAGMATIRDPTQKPSL